LGSIPLLRGHVEGELDTVVLPERDTRDRRKSEERGAHRENGQQVPTHELRGCNASRPVAPTGLAVQVSIQIVHERFDRWISTIRLFAHRHGDDGIQVAAEPDP